MALKKWNKVIRSEMGVYYPIKNNWDILKFPRELSHLTNLSLDIFANVISQKNVIINFPDFKLGPASLFAYIFADKFDKSVYILNDERGDSLDSRSKVSLNKNHYLLCNYGKFIFHNLPVFYLKKLKENEENYQNNSVHYKLTLKKYLPKAEASFKRKYTEENVLNNKFHPKFILDTDSKLFSIKEKLNVILKTHDEYLNPEEHPIGLIIIENADRFFRSFTRLENFIDWFKELDSDVKLLIHFNNPSIDYIKVLVDELDFAVIPFNKYILESNNYLKTNSKEYFSSIDPNDLDLLNRYNLDSKFLFNKKQNVSIHDPLYSGSIDSFFGSAYASFKRVDLDNVYNQYSIHKARELLFNLYNLAINPIYIKISFKINNTWIRGSIPHFIQNFKSRLYMENSKNRFFIHSFLDSLSNMYYELANCMRVNENLGYTRKGKDYILYELVEDLVKKGEEVIIGTYLDTEPNILNEIFEKGNRSTIDSITPINMGMLIQKPDSDKKGKTLVLPGVIPEVFTSELFKPYKKIVILTYEGKNYKFLKEQLDNQLGNILEEKQYMDYLKEILEPFDEVEGNEIFEDFYDRFDLIEFEEAKTPQDTEIIEQEIEEPDADIFNVDLDLKEYMGEWEKSKSNLGMDLSNEISQKNYDTIEFRLKNINTNDFVIKKLPVNKSYLTFSNIRKIDDATELKPSEFNSGDYIIIIDNDEKKSLLSLIIEFSNLKSVINMSLVEYWKLEFLNFIESNNLRYSDIYNIYCDLDGEKTYQTVAGWCKGEVIAPQEAIDLYIIGEILNNGFIMDNYQSMFRQIQLLRKSHAMIGKKLKKMIKSILTDEYLDVSSLNEAEYLIYENIQNGIYQIV